MHNLRGTFVIELESSKDVLAGYHPLKIVLPPLRSRILYFETKDEQKNWGDKLRQLAGYREQEGLYKVGKELGRGHFGSVRFGVS